jgi:hypothetical protein
LAGRVEDTELSIGLAQDWRLAKRFKAISADLTPEEWNDAFFTGSGYVCVMAMTVQQADLYVRYWIGWGGRPSQSDWKRPASLDEYGWRTEMVVPFAWPQLGSKILSDLGISGSRDDWQFWDVRHSDSWQHGGKSGPVSKCATEIFCDYLTSLNYRQLAEEWKHTSTEMQKTWFFMSRICSRHNSCAAWHRWDRTKEATIQILASGLI